MLLIPFALTYAYGRLVGDQKQGWVIFAAMFFLWISAAGLAMWWETSGNPNLTAVGATQQVTSDQSGGNFEGKEIRFGPMASGLFAASTTGTSTGSVDSMHDSYTPRGGAVPLVNIMLGEVSPGGVGAGLYGMLIFVLLAVFIAGSDGRANTGVPREEDPSARDEARRPVHPGGAHRDPRVRRSVGRDTGRGRIHAQPGTPRV